MLTASTGKVDGQVCIFVFTNIKHMNVNLRIYICVFCRKDLPL